MTGKTATVLVRVEPDVKEKAEAILNELGVPMSVVLNMCLKQIIRTESIPFDVTLNRRPRSIGDLTPEEFRAEIMESYGQFRDGKTRSADEVMSELRKIYDGKS